MDLARFLLVAVLIATIGSFGADCFKVSVYERLEPRANGRTLDQIMLDSVATYKTQALRAAQQGVHLIVFPEYGLTGLKLITSRETTKPYLQVLSHLHVNSSDHWIPCLDDDTGFNVTIMHRMSCAAREAGIVIVFNLGTLIECEHSDSSCPADGYYQFNTNVAFDVDGTVLATYHKINLYLEPFDYPPSDYSSTGVSFTTSEATFGLITCFDIMWLHPFHTLVRQGGVRYIIQPTAWIDGLPCAISVQSQMAFAIAMNITLLSANLHAYPANRGGSGIYSGHRGQLNYTYGSLSEDLLVIADTDGETNPNPVLTNTHINYDDLIYGDLSAYSLFKMASPEGRVLATSGNLTCLARYAFETETETETDEQDDSHGYYLGAFQGAMSAGNHTYRLAVEDCVVLWCSNEDELLTTCARPPVAASQTRIKFLKIQGNFTTSHVYPSVLDGDVRLVDKSHWSFFSKVDQHSTTTVARISTEEQFKHRPLVVALFGRNYDQDQFI